MIWDNAVKLSRTRKGYPALWESGGGSTHTGHSTIIADANGGSKVALFTRFKDSNGKHALFPVSVGDIVIDASHHRGEFRINVYKIAFIPDKSVEPKDDYANLVVINRYFEGEWDDEELAQKHEEAILASGEKAMDYHCRSPYYYENKN